MRHLFTGILIVAILSIRSGLFFTLFWLAAGSSADDLSLPVSVQTAELEWTYLIWGLTYAAYFNSDFSLSRTVKPPPSKAPPRLPSWIASPLSFTVLTLLWPAFYFGSLLVVAAGRLLDDSDKKAEGSAFQSIVVGIWVYVGLLVLCPSLIGAIAFAITQHRLSG